MPTNYDTVCASYGCKEWSDIGWCDRDWNSTYGILKKSTNGVETGTEIVPCATGLMKYIRETCRCSCKSKGNTHLMF